MSDIRSERLAWAEVSARMLAILRAAEKDDCAAVRRHAEGVLELARGMAVQVHQGVHTNPPLMLYGNPPMRAGRSAQGAGSMARVEFVASMSDDVHSVHYTHEADGKDYVHEFDPGVSMDAAVLRGRKVIVLQRLDGKPVWKDF